MTNEIGNTSAAEKCAAHFLISRFTLAFIHAAQRREYLVTLHCTYSVWLVVSSQGSPWQVAAVGGPPQLDFFALILYLIKVSRKT